MTPASPASLTQAVALDPHYYIDPHWAQVEQERIFRPAWHFVAHCSDLAGRGDHVVTEVAGQPVILIRQGDGAIRAFHNVCRHRAGPLATCNGKGASRLRCQYHGWHYGLDGHLLAAPEMVGAEGFDKAAVRLPEIAVALWQGLVFVSLAADPLPIETLLAGIAERIAPYDLTVLQGSGFQTYEVACNWKVYIDNYAEGYHLPYVHPSLTRIVDYEDYTTELGDYHSLQLSPITDPDGPYGDGTAYYYLIWPNLMLNILPNRLQVNRVRPLGVDRCAVDFIWYFAAGSASMDRIASDLAFSDQVQAEDAAICAHVQRGLTAGGYVPGRLSPKREAGVWHFQQLLRKAYALGR